MNGEVLQFRKTANVSVDTLRIFLNEKQASRNFYKLWSAVLECDVQNTKNPLLIKFISNRLKCQC